MREANRGGWQEEGGGRGGWVEASATKHVRVGSAWKGTDQQGVCGALCGAGFLAGTALKSLIEGFCHYPL